SNMAEQVFLAHVGDRRRVVVVHIGVDDEAGHIVGSFACRCRLCSDIRHHCETYHTNYMNDSSHDKSPSSIVDRLCHQANSLPSLMSDRTPSPFVPTTARRYDSGDQRLSAGSSGIASLAVRWSATSAKRSTSYAMHHDALDTSTACASQASGLRHMTQS